MGNFKVVFICVSDNQFRNEQKQLSLCSGNVGKFSFAHFLTDDFQCSKIAQNFHKFGFFIMNKQCITQEFTSTRPSG